MQFQLELEHLLEEKTDGISTYMDTLLAGLKWTLCFFHISLGYGARHRYRNRHDSYHAEQMGGPRSQWLR